MNIAVKSIGNGLSTSPSAVGGNLYPVYCSWCGDIIRYVDYPHSHGICLECMEKELNNSLIEWVKQ